MSKTLLEKAKAVKLKTGKVRRVKDKEEIELAVAWLRDEIGITQIMKATGIKYNNSIYHFLLYSIRQGVKDGTLILKEAK